MPVSVGGFINQAIIKGRERPGLWDEERTVMSNLQLFDATVFKHIVGMDARPTPVTAAAYAKHGYLYFTLYEQPSAIIGDFPRFSVGDLDKAEGINKAT